MSILEPVPYIQEVNAGIGITKYAPGDRYYRTLVPANLPTAYTYPRQGHTTGDADLFITKRIYEIAVYVTPLTMSASSGTSTMAAGELLTEYLLAWQSLLNDDDDNVFDDGTKTGYRIQMDYGQPLNDSGILHDLQWLPEEYYIGFRIFLPMMIHGGNRLIA